MDEHPINVADSMISFVCLYVHYFDIITKQYNNQNIVRSSHQTFYIIKQTQFVDCDSCIGMFSGL